MTQSYDEYNKSNLCKTDCIDVGRNYCVNEDFLDGWCCAPNDKTCADRFSHCSYDNKNAPYSFKYIYCPPEAHCGSKEF